MIGRRVGHAAAAAALVAAGACAGGLDDRSPGGPPDAVVPSCGVFVTTSPASLVAPATVRVDAHVTDAPGVLAYTWDVRRGGAAQPFTPAAADQSAIEFEAPEPDVYVVRVAVDAGAVTCPTVEEPINVRADNANMLNLRLHVVPPASSGAPPLDELRQVLGGGNASLGTVVLDPGIVVTQQVRAGAAGVPAYLRFLPDGSPRAIVETFSDGNGAFSARLLNRAHTVLVVPAVPGLAPRLVTGWMPSTITVDAGVAVTGVVRDPDDAPLADAKVQLAIGGVPTTLATTAADGSFTVRAAAGAGAMTTIDVAPPPGRGLPRLTATAAFDPAQPFAVRYAPGLVVRELAGAVVRRAGAPVANARLDVIGAVPAAGTVTNAGTPRAADGAVRVTVTTSGGGVVPALRAPAAVLAAVTTIGPDDHAVAPCDLTAGAPEQIDAPPPQAFATEVRAPASSAALPHAFVDAVPIGPLARGRADAAVHRRRDRRDRRDARGRRPVRAADRRSARARRAGRRRGRAGRDRGGVRARAEPAPARQAGGAGQRGAARVGVGADPVRVVHRRRGEPPARRDRVERGGRVRGRGAGSGDAAVTARRALLALALVAACGDHAGSIDPGDPDASPAPGDGPPSCGIALAVTPGGALVAPAAIRVDATVYGAPGVLGYAWRVSRGTEEVPFLMAAADGSAIELTATVADSYRVQLDVEGSACATADEYLNVLAGNAATMNVRLHVVPPAGVAAPPRDELLLVHGGANYTLGTVVVDPGVDAAAHVRAGGDGVPAYLRFAPDGAATAIVETFAAPSGAFTARLLNRAHTVLVIPAVPGLAPRRVTGWMPASGAAIQLDAGAAITGTVRDPAGAPLAGASVQLAIAGVPTTLATTTAGGAFTVRGVLAAGAEVTVDVAPPAGSGLPRLAASSTAFVLAGPIEIAYAPGLAVRDLAGVKLQREGADLPGAAAAVVGTLADAGTVSAGPGTTTTATGPFRAAATAAAPGALPAPRAPPAPLPAVVSVSDTDHAASALDLTAGAPAAIDAPPAQAAVTVVRKPDTEAPLPHAIVDAVPTGALALAGVRPVRAIADASGAAALALAAGATYELRLRDPLGRGGPRTVAGATAATIAPAYTLPRSLRLRGKLRLQGGGAIAGAAVQVLCAACSGLAAGVPGAERASLPTGDFEVAILDPGTM